MEIGIDIVFLIAGLILIFLGIFFIRNACIKIRNWNTASGTVVGYKEFQNQQGKQSSYLPQVQFASDDGKMITFASSNDSSRRPYRIGATIKVLYAPGDPAKATIKSVSNLFLLPFFLILFGVAFSGMFLSMIFFGPHR
jgi:Protein of unknown function (DUF3592)